MSEKLTAVFSVDRTTINTIRFQEEGEERPIFNTIYVQKWAVAKLGENKSGKIRVTLEVEDGQS